MKELLQEIAYLKKRIERLERNEKLYIPVWDDYVINPLNVKLDPSNPPTATTYKGSYVLSFAKNSTNKCYASMQLPHSYMTGSAIEFHLHLAYINANAGNSVWSFTHSWANIGGTFPAETTVPATIAAAEETDHHQLAEIASTISGTGKTLSSIVLISLSRVGGDGSDNYDEAIYLTGMDFHIQRDALGSRQETIK